MQKLWEKGSKISATTAPQQPQTPQILVSSDINTPIAISLEHRPVLGETFKSRPKVTPSRLLVCRPCINNCLLASQKTNGAGGEIVGGNARLQMAQDAISAILVSRATLILISEMQVLNMYSLGHLILIAVPLLISVQQLTFKHDAMFAKSDILNFLFNGLRIGVIYGMCWVAPSAFVSSIANLPSFAIFMFASRAISSATCITFAIFDHNVTFMLLGMTAVYLLPCIMLVMCILQGSYNNLYIVFQVAVGVDFIACILVELIELCACKRRISSKVKDTSPLQQSLSRTVHDMQELLNHQFEHESRISDRQALFVTVLLGCTLLHIYPTRPDEMYPFSLVAVPFSVFQFLFGAAAGILVLSLVYIYILMLDRHKTNLSEGTGKLQQSNLSSTFQRIFLCKRTCFWLHPLLSVFILAIQGSLWYAVQESYQDIGSIPRILAIVPLNASTSLGTETVISLLPAGSNATVQGMYYLQSAAKIIEKQAEQLHLGSSRLTTATVMSESVLMVSVGLYLTTIALMEMLENMENMKSMKNKLSIAWERRHRLMIANFTAGMAMTIGGVFINWTSVHLVAPIVCAMITAFLSVCASIFV